MRINRIFVVIFGLQLLFVSAASLLFFQSIVRSIKTADKEEKLKTYLPQPSPTPTPQYLLRPDPGTKQSKIAEDARPVWDKQQKFLTDKGNFVHNYYLTLNFSGTIRSISPTEIALETGVESLVLTNKSKYATAYTDFSPADGGPPKQIKATDFSRGDRVVVQLTVEPVTGIESIRHVYKLGNADPNAIIF